MWSWEGDMKSIINMGEPGATLRKRSGVMQLADTSPQSAPGLITRASPSESRAPWLD